MKIIWKTSLILLLLSSCSLIFEEDLSESTVEVIMPESALTTTETKQLFWWDYINQALDYSIQIVEGSFNNVSDLVIDSIVSTNKFKITLEPGSYEWRIQALNYYSSSMFSYGTLVIQDTTTATLIQLPLL